MRPLLTDLYPHWWYNRMRSSSWNAPAVSVLLGLIGGFAEPRTDARGSHLIPNSCSADCSACDWECPCPRAGPGRHTWKTSLWPCRGRDPGCKCILAYLVGESTCQVAECSPSGLFSAELDSQWASKSGGDLKSEGFMLWNKQKCCFPCLNILGSDAACLISSSSERSPQRFWNCTLGSDNTTEKVLISCSCHLAAIQDEGN